MLEETLSSDGTVNGLDHENHLGEQQWNDSVMLEGGCGEFLKKPELVAQVWCRHRISSGA